MSAPTKEEMLRVNETTKSNIRRRKLRHYEWGGCKPLEFSFADSPNNAERNAAAKIASRICHKFNHYFKAIKESNLIYEIKKDILLNLVRKYKGAIFSDLKSRVINDKDKRAIYYYVITKYRQWRTAKEREMYIIEPAKKLIELIKETKQARKK